MISPEARHAAQVISWLCGWLYFFAWSASFYPQAILNIRRRTTEGLMPDFPFLNVYGFTCYSINTAVFLFSPVVRHQYALRNPESPEPTVQPNDLAFGVHAWVLCVITYSQFWPQLWGWEGSGRSRRQKTTVTRGVFWGSLLGLAILVALVALEPSRGDAREGMDWGWIDVMYGLSYVKLLLTIFKYVPQVIANIHRKSTKGWSINQVWFDFIGGILSFAQLLIDSGLQADWSGLTGNPVKLGLAVISLFFDAVFLSQHYVFYGPVEEKIARDPEVMVDSSANGAAERQSLISHH